MKGERRLLPIEEAADRLGVSPYTVRRLVWSGRLPHVRIGRLVRVDSADLYAWIDREKVRNGGQE
jgi:excisionase family DNA binding protein